MGALAEGARNDTDWLKYQDTKSLPKRLGAARKPWTIRVSVSLRGGSRAFIMLVRRRFGCGGEEYLDK
jgi:hypothetical protein